MSQHKGCLLFLLCFSANLLITAPLPHMYLMCGNHHRLYQLVFAIIMLCNNYKTLVFKEISIHCSYVWDWLWVYLIWACSHIWGPPVCLLI